MLLKRGLSVSLPVVLIYMDEAAYRSIHDRPRGSHVSSSSRERRGSWISSILGMPEHDTFEFGAQSEVMLTVRLSVKRGYLWTASELEGICGKIGAKTTAAVPFKTVYTRTHRMAAFALERNDKVYR